MKTVYKRIVSALTAAILLSLCLAPTVFATEEPPGNGDTSIESAIETELAEETPEPSTATPSDAQEEETLQPDHFNNNELSSDPTKPAATPEPPVEGTAAEPAENGTEMETGPTKDSIFIEPVTATPSEAVEVMPTERDTAATAEELMEWLSGHEDSGGTVWLSADISLCDISYIRNLKKPAITVNTGEFCITADGSVELLSGSPFTIRGIGGENGIMRASEGSMLHLKNLTLEAEEGFAVFQEECAGLVFTQCNLGESTVHYAETPFVWEWKPSMAVVKPGQTAADVLPETAEAYDVNRLGQLSREKVPVVWELAGHEVSEEQRLRFAVVGSTPGFAYGSAPVCTVVYDDFPLTFLDVKAKKREVGRGESYLFTGTFSIPEDRLPITITQDYSFDGENWTVYEESEVRNLTSFGISFSAKAWDIQSFPNVFIRLSWNDGGTVYYSNVLRYARDNMEEGEDHGGNRGGGTDIVNPPKQPAPDPEPETTPPETIPPETSKPETIPPPGTLEPLPGQPGNSGTDHESDGSGEGAASPPAGSGGSHGEEPSHSITQKPDLSGESSDGGAAPPLSVPEPTSGPGPVSDSALSNETVVSSAVAGEETKSPSAEVEPSPSHALSNPVSEPSESTAQISAVKDETLEDTIPVTIPETPSASDGAAAPLLSGEDAEVLAEPEAETPVPGPDMLPIAAGLAAVAASIGGAALYLHPKAYPKGHPVTHALRAGRTLCAKVWKRLLGKLRNHIRR